jgi:hypothetical protein
LLPIKGHAHQSSAQPTAKKTRDRGKRLKRGRRSQSARARRIPVVEGLKDCREPAALMHDVAKVTVNTTDSRGMTVNTNDEERLMQIKI